MDTVGPFEIHNEQFVTERGRNHRPIDAIIQEDAADRGKGLQLGSLANSLGPQCFGHHLGSTCDLDRQRVPALAARSK